MNALILINYMINSMLLGKRRSAKLFDKAETYENAATIGGLF